jgi:hypothetical protein
MFKTIRKKDIVSVAEKSFDTSLKYVESVFLTQESRLHILQETKAPFRDVHLITDGCGGYEVHINPTMLCKKTVKGYFNA